MLFLNDHLGEEDASEDLLLWHYDQSQQKPTYIMSLEVLDINVSTAHSTGMKVQRVLG